ncbi:MAG: YwiC-like family protein, partial [Acidimicrobiia bacterium]|nr:YwiC-like family protein [Acidimicrobiia bacterium]
AALLAFTARTPLKIVLVDRWRGRWMARSDLAARIAATEIAVIVVLVAVAIGTAEAAFWWPLVLAGPLIAVELWYDMRSRSRRLIPELAGAVGIASIAAVIALSGGAEASVASGLWLVMATRSLAAIPFVRVQLLRAKNQSYLLWHSDVAQVVAVAAGVVGWVADIVPLAAVAALAIQAMFEVVAVRRPPQRAALIGAQQVVVGLTVVLITALAVRAP